MSPSARVPDRPHARPRRARAAGARVLRPARLDGALELQDELRDLQHPVRAADRRSTSPSGRSRGMSATSAGTRSTASSSRRCRCSRSWSVERRGVRVQPLPLPRAGPDARPARRSACILPLQSYFIAQSTMFTRLELTDTYWALIIPYTAMGLPLATYLLKVYLDALPEELFEAARIDGAGDLRIFLMLALPLLQARPRHRRGLLGARRAGTSSCSRCSTSRTTRSRRSRPGCSPSRAATSPTTACCSRRCRSSRCR